MDMGYILLRSSWLYKATEPGIKEGVHGNKKHPFFFKT